MLDKFGFLNFCHCDLFDICDLVLVIYNFLNCWILGSLAVISESKDKHDNKNLGFQRVHSGIRPRIFEVRR